MYHSSSISKQPPPLLVDILYLRGIRSYNCPKKRTHVHTHIHTHINTPTNIQILDLATHPNLKGLCNPVCHKKMLNIRGQIIGQLKLEMLLQNRKFSQKIKYILLYPKEKKSQMCYGEPLTTSFVVTDTPRNQNIFHSVKRYHETLHQSLDLSKIIFKICKYRQFSNDF